MTTETLLPADPTPVTPQEAAWITGLSAKTINAAIDRGEVRPIPRPRRRGVTSRRLGAAEVVYLVVRKEAGQTLSPKARRELYRRLTELNDCTGRLSSGGANATAGGALEVSLAGGVVRVAMKDACAYVAKRWSALRSAERFVVEDPEIRGGEPVLRGTRIPVSLVADLISEGASAEEMCEDYPALTMAMIEAALAYAHTHPRRGRPPKGPWAIKAATKLRPRR